jgi:hypothetical protein
MTRRADRRLLIALLVAGVALAGGTAAFVDRSPSDADDAAATRSHKDRTAEVSDGPRGDEPPTSSSSTVPSTTTVLASTTTAAPPAPTTTSVAPPAAPSPPPTASAGPCRVFPADNPWNTDVSAAPLHPRSAAFIDSIGRADHLHPDVGTFWDGAPIGIPYVRVGAGQPKVPISFGYADESDPGPYPIPPDAPIEGGASSDGDRHVLVVDDSACRLYELFDAHPVDGGRAWQAGSGAAFDLRSNALRPDGWTSADAAGLPIFPGLIRYDEVVEQGAIRHALRFTVSRTQRGYIHPATHFASSITDPNVPPMGLRLRMRAGYSCAAYSREVQVICAALKRYGMFVADNGSDWYLTGAHDPRWNDDALGDLKQIPGDAFEAVDTGPVRH